MWVLKRTSDGKFVGKSPDGSSYTDSIRSAEKFDTEEIARCNSCAENEIPVEVDLIEYFKRKY